MCISDLWSDTFVLFLGLNTLSYGCGLAARKLTLMGFTSPITLVQVTLDDSLTLRYQGHTAMSICPVPS
jgi:hypothetical protein